MTNILVVEDNPAFRNGAEKYFASRSDVQVVYASDFNTARGHLTAEPRTIDAAIIDCFFPATQGAGSEDLAIGQMIVAVMECDDPQEQRILKGLEVFGRYIDFDDELRGYARACIASISGSIEDNVLVKALEQVSFLGREATTQIAKNTLALGYDARKAPKDNYTALKSAMEQSPANQPLGIPLADGATMLGIPFVLATSTYHHDILTQPLQDYASRKGWTLIDCIPGQDQDKETPQYWARAMRELERRIEAVRNH